MSVLDGFQTIAGRPSIALQPFMRPMSFAAGTCIFKSGAPADGFYMIDDGRVRIQLDRNELDADDVLAFLEPGSLLGELSLLDGLPRSASAYAHTDVVARKVTLEDIDNLAASDPQGLVALYAALGRNAALKLRLTNQRLADAVFEPHDGEVNELVARAKTAQRLVADWSEERIDRVLLTVAQSIAAKARELAELTVRVTRIGNANDKFGKNIAASMGIFRSIAGQPAGGTLRADEVRRITELGSPAGVVVGLIPVTNPVATASFKALIAVKGRNAIILSFHRSADELATVVMEIIHEALEREGAPVDLVQRVKRGASRAKTDALMRHPDVSLVLATGSASMVRAAYSSGTPAIGVGPGNAPALICADADIAHAAESVVVSKSYDNGLICGAENHVIVVDAVRDAMGLALEAAGAAVLSESEATRFLRAAVEEKSGELRRQIVGQSASNIARVVGIERPYPIQLIVVPTEGVTGNPLAAEKMAPVVSLYGVPDEESGIALSAQLLEHEGTGHTAVIHTKTAALIDRFATAMPASRILVNSPAAHGIMGFTTGLTPSLTLGTGTFGRTSTTDNVSYQHLLNIKRVAHYTL